jgi:hypothetical protein
VTKTNPGSARRRRAVFGPLAEKTREREKRDFSREDLGNAAFPKELFGAPPNGSRGPRVLPRSYANTVSLTFVFINLMAMCS